MKTTNKRQHQSILSSLKRHLVTVFRKYFPAVTTKRESQSRVTIFNSDEQIESIKLDLSARNS